MSSLHFPFSFKNIKTCQDCNSSLMPCPFTCPKMSWAGPNFFVPDQKFIHTLWQSQTFCARQKDDLHSVKLVFVPAQKFLKRH